ncbi:hypothetical protein GH714_036988 [Hevea brasiliensis]|uniref:Helicase-like transcription factor CHR28 n=1 Tax=Hevea brasiliensis TaxID=3981 RepID=A0A6A6NF81_HEVBR|nr:hypothetical protein GH714_036988 [Hevea brasiliensis]
MAAIVPIDICSDSDSDVLLEDDEFDTSPTRRYTESRVLPSWATTSWTNFGNDSLDFMANGNMGGPQTVNSRQALKRTLPASLHRSPISSKSANLVENGCSSHTRDIHGSTYHLAGPSLTNNMRAHYRKGNYEDIVIPMVGEESVAGNDKRLIYQAALEDLNQPKTAATPPDGLLSVPLLRHQKIALAWMVQKETRSLHCLGGILVDHQKNLDDDDKNSCPGLHKVKRTGESDDIKSIPEVSTSMQPFRRKRSAAGTLVVCPASILQQWARELDDKVADEAKLTFLVYHGGSRTRDPVELANYDVVLTIHSIAANEVPKRPLVDEDEADEKDGEQYGLSSEFLINKKRWKMTNVSKKRKKGRKGIDSSSVDYDCGPLASVAWFRVILDEGQTIKNHRTQVARACCSLRTKRRWCLSGTPIQNAIDDLYSYFRFLRYDPYSIYKSFYTTIMVPISRNSLHGYKKIQVVLRAIMLCRKKGTLIDGEPIIKLPPKSICLTKVDFSMEERAFYTQLEADSRSKFKACAASGTVNQNYANILLMLFRLRQACDRPLLVKSFNSDLFGKVSAEMAKRLPSDMVIDLMKCLATSSAISHACNDPPEDPVVTICGHVFCYQCVSDYLTGDENTCPSRGCKEQLGSDVVFSEATLKSCVSDNRDVGPKHPEFDNKSMVLQHERLDGTMTLAARDRAVNDFTTDPVVTVMVMSLKAGNLGLNMVAACHAILLDLGWNPTTEDQAVERAHRIVFFALDLDLQEEKRKMVASAFVEDPSGGSATRLKVEDLKYLFMGRSTPGV